MDYFSIPYLFASSKHNVGSLIVVVKSEDVLHAPGGFSQGFGNVHDLEEMFWGSHVGKIKEAYK